MVSKLNTDVIYCGTAVNYHDTLILKNVGAAVNYCGICITLAPVNSNGTAHIKNGNNYLNTNIYSYLRTSGGLSSNLYLKVVDFFNASVN